VNLHTKKSNICKKKKYSKKQTRLCLSKADLDQRYLRGFVNKNLSWICFYFTNKSIYIHVQSSFRSSLSRSPKAVLFRLTKFPLENLHIKHKFLKAIPYKYFGSKRALHMYNFTYHRYFSWFFDFRAALMPLKCSDVS
jgi:hypothetical protein